MEKLSDAENKEVSKNETESTKEKLEKVITHGAVELLIESIEKRVRRDLPEKEVRQWASAFMNANLHRQKSVES